MCRCGSYHPNLSCKQFLTEITLNDLTELLTKSGYKAQVSEDTGSGYVRITTTEFVDLGTKEAIEASIPPGVKVSWVCNYGNKEVPKCLANWWKSTQRYIK